MFVTSHKVSTTTPGTVLLTFTYSEESVSLLGFLTENTWGEPHRGVGAPPSQLIIPGNPIPSRDEDLPLATWMEPLPGLPFSEATCNQCSVASQVVGSVYFLPPPNNGITGWLLCPPSIYMDSGDPHSRLYAWTKPWIHSSSEWPYLSS